ncbi:hypothetical protein BEQ56_07270 [Anaerolineaceae bacterium oral taxon 439]|nr:hypothetical protein BEQ56_07270 [Anaerolineaceae bacterium oral taxon 439]
MPGFLPGRVYRHSELVFAETGPPAQTDRRRALRFGGFLDADLVPCRQAQDLIDEAVFPAETVQSELVMARIR